MAKGDIKIRECPYSAIPTYTWLVVSGTLGSIKAGELVKESGTNTRYAALAADADFVIGTGQPIIGVCASDSTDTVAAEGKVEVYMPLPGIVYELPAKDSTLINTQALIDAMTGDYMILDVASGANGKITIDTAAGAVSTAAFGIIGGDPDRKVLYFIIRQDATFHGRAQV